MASFAIAVTGWAPRAIAAEKLHFAPVRTAQERSCLVDLIRASGSRYAPDAPEMMSTAKVAKTALDGDRRQANFYLFHGLSWCGTAGCKLLIGEVQSGGRCHLLYDNAGFEHAIEVLRARDHGYRRLYTPCETRFDGKEYQQVREECPTLDVQR